WVSGKSDLGGKSAAHLPEITKSAAVALGQELRNESRAVLTAWDDLTTNRERLDRFFGPYFGAGQLDQIHAWCLRQARIRIDGDRDGEHPSLDAEDHALILRLFQAIRGPLVDVEGAPLGVTHLFVDEVQDTSAIELKILLDVAGARADGATDPTGLSV